MKVKEILSLAATQLGIAEEVQAYFDGADTAGEKNADLLLTCFNLVENELALDYLPLKKVHAAGTENGGDIPFADFSHSVVRVLQVCDEKGNSLPFDIFPTYIRTSSRAVSVAYTYTPEEKGFDDTSDYADTPNVSARLLAYGVAAEYCLMMGLYEESGVWDKKYKDAIEAARSLANGGRAKSRRWI